MNKRSLKLFSWSLLVLFLLMNVIAFFHSYKFTHFSTENIEKTGDPNSLSFTQKLSTLFFGINNPRPENNAQPAHPFEVIHLPGNKATECWLMKADSAKGTVIVFHGYSGNKAMMLDKSDIFLKLGYNTLLVDFMGSGGSEGVQTTIGYYEAEQVKSCYDYLTGLGEKKIYLFGTSMGAAAIMKSINDYKLQPNGIILECPFGSMYKTVCARFKTMNAPTFPMAGLLVFWGGVQNNFWAFGHNPSEYAKSINCPALLMYGEKDEKVSRQETDEIFNNITGRKHLKLYPNAGHENYLNKYEKEWTNDVSSFLQ